MARNSKTSLTKSEREEIGRRIARHQNGESKSHPWSEAKRIILGDRYEKLKDTLGDAPEKRA